MRKHLLMSWDSLPRTASAQYHLSNANYTQGGLSSFQQKVIRGGSVLMGPAYLTANSEKV